jgi:anti-anti-sigma factor
MNCIIPELLVCTEGDAVCVRIRGRADVSVSVGFKALLTRMIERHFQQYEVELSECQLMDSTFLGVLCGFAARREETGDSRPILLNPNDRIRGLVESLGVDDLFAMSSGNPVTDLSNCAHVARTEEPSRLALKETSLEAHRTLIALNPDNLPKFKELTEFLAADVKNLKANP